MAIPEKISEAINQTELKIKSFRKAMLVLLFEWQNLETRLELTEKCFQENYPLPESASQSSPDLGSIRFTVERRLTEVEQKERDFMAFQDNGLREMEVREDKLGILRKEISLREKRVIEQEGLVEMERKLIGEKEKQIEDCLRENLSKEEELRKRVQELELKEKRLEMMEKDLELREKVCNSKQKVNSASGAAVFRIAGPSNQSMALVNVSGTSSGKQISRGRLRSKAWQHFTKMEKGEGSADKCKCNYCSRIFTLCGGGTSQLLRHISEGRCPAYQKRILALPIDEMLSGTHSQQSVEVEIKESFIRPCNAGEDTRTLLLKGSEEGVKQELATNLLEPELQTQPHMEQTAVLGTCAIPNTSSCEYNYQPQQSEDLSKDQSDPSFDQQSYGMENSGIPPPLSRCSVSFENSENIIGMGDPDRYCPETQLRNKGSSDIDENASSDSSEELQMFTCEVDKLCCSGDQITQNRKREREHIIEQNESNDVFLHSDIDDLSSHVRKHCSRKSSEGDDENTEDVLHEVDPVSCIMPIDPAQELYGHMMNQKDLTHEGSMP